MLQNSIHICYFLDVFFISIPLKSVLYCSLGSVPPEDLLIREEPDMFFRPGKRIATTTYMAADTITVKRVIAH